MPAGPQISVIIVSWNAKAHLRQCLESLHLGNHFGLSETIVVENASSDGSAEMVRDEYPWATLVQTGANLGFAKGNNIGIDVSSGKYLCLINSDVEIFPDTIANLFELMEKRQDIGLAGPTVLNSDRTPQSNCRDMPTIWNSLCRTFSLDTLFPGWSAFGNGLAMFPTGGDVIPVDVLTGCFWFVRRQALGSVGKLDERFFMYGEDLDWCKRFRDAGWQVIYTPTARVVHHGGASSGEAPLKYFIELNRAQLQYWGKYHSTASSLVYLGTLIAHNVLRVVGYGLSCLFQPDRGTEIRHKITRSWECLKWLVREGFSSSRKSSAPANAISSEKDFLGTGGCSVGQAATMATKISD